MIRRNESLPAGMVFKGVVAAAGALVSAYLLWKLRTLIPPIVIGGLAAYICNPLVAKLERYLVKRGLAIGLLLLSFLSLALFIVNRIRAVVPTETGVVELKVRGLYKINEAYRSLMGLDASLARGNWIYGLVHAELDPKVNWINHLLALTPEETSKFLDMHKDAHDTRAVSDRLLEYHRGNLTTLKMRTPAALKKKETLRAVHPVVAEMPEQLLKTPVATTAGFLSTWIVAPLTFLFLLQDTGEIKSGLLRIVPNRLFEPALRVLADLDLALGNYLRGLFLESVLLGFTAGLLLAIVGLPLRWAVAIGIFAAMTNAVPYLGSAIAFIGGLAYAFLAEEVHPLIPMVNTENLAIWVIAAVGLSEVLKNIFYEPLILGSAVKLHPLIIVIGVIGGGMLFNLFGVLLAVPVIAILRVFISSTTRELKSYNLI